MKNGLLWYDADPHAGVSEKLTRAAQRYRQKLGRWPSVCYTHPAELGSMAAEVECRPEGGTIIRIRLAAAAQILPHHFWLGEEDEAAAGGTAHVADRTEEASTQAGNPPAPVAALPQRKAARRQREQVKILQEAMTARTEGGSRTAKARGAG